MNSMNRRSFLARWASLLGVFLVGEKVFAERKRGGGDAKKDGAAEVKMVDASSPVAKAVNYSENPSAIKDAKLKIERSGVAFDKQTCKNCGFFSNLSKKGSTEIGDCQIFSGQKVKAEAWCSSWNKKA